jgi:protoheme IX farnesyltransferase
MKDSSTLSPGLRDSYVGGSIKDYLSLMKPRVMSLVVFTALVGMISAPGSMHPLIGFVAILCISLAAGSAAAINMWYDRDIDALMIRTKMRPIVLGKIDPDEALSFGIICGFLSLLLAALCVNLQAALLIAFTISYYVLIYTFWLKRRSLHNVVIGGVSGAMPPVIGWVSVTGSIDLHAILLFLIIFLWTPPHSWALAIYRVNDYKNCGVPMLPVVKGMFVTKLKIVFYGILTVISSYLPFYYGMSQLGYCVIVSVLNVVFLYYLFILLVRYDKAALCLNSDAKKLFLCSIFYLFAVFCTLSVF